MLPARFGLILDGWSHRSLHFYAIVACYYDSETNEKRELLLDFSPPLQEDDFSAFSISELVRSTLEIYNASLRNVALFPGDNCSVNIKLSKDTKIPLIGCAYHRLSLATKELLSHHEGVLSQINELMGKLKDLKFAAILREKTMLVPVQRNKPDGAALSK